MLEEAARGVLTQRESLALLYEREIVCKDSRRIETAIGLARFPDARDLADFDFSAQASIDGGQIWDVPVAGLPAAARR